MKFGFDLDNTIFDYTAVLAFIGEHDSRLSSLQNKNKADIKHYLQTNFGKDAWTELQGDIYTKYLHKVEKPTIAKKLLTDLSEQNQVYVFSHKTQYPIIGPRVDMREAAILTLEAFGFPLGKEDGAIEINFFNTVREKVQAVESANLNFYLDDLTEILDQLTHKSNNLGYFNPDADLRSKSPYIEFRSWIEVDLYMRREFLHERP